MASLKKLVHCKCGKDSLFEFSTELDLDDVTIAASCPSCRSAIQVVLSAAFSSKGNVNPAASALAPAQPADTPAAANDDPLSGEDYLAEAHKELSENLDYDRVSSENVQAAVNELFNE